VALIASQFTQREKRLDKLQGKLMDLDDKTAEAQKTVAKIQPSLQQHLSDVRASVCGLFVLQ
jgi:acyl carrier protein phosphodiesterase